MSNPVLEWMQANLNQPMSADAPSAVGRWLGGTLREAREGVLVGDFTVRPEMTNPIGCLHGGITAAIMDDMIGAAVFALGREDNYTTIDLSINYLARAREGDVVTAKVRLVKPGKQIIYAECDLSSAEGKLLARGRANLVRLEKRD